MNIVINIPKDNDLITLEQIDNLPISLGIYKFYDNSNNLLYIGKTNNLRIRIKQHLGRGVQSTNFKGEVKYISYFIVYSHADMDIYETYLINKLKPRYNIDKTFYKLDYKDESINRDETEIKLDGMKFHEVRRVAKDIGVSYTVTTSKKEIIKNILQQVDMKELNLAI